MPLIKYLHVNLKINFLHFISVSICCHQAEHQNMQTQYFSAEVEEEMRQWINALNLASNMQKDPL